MARFQAALTQSACAKSPFAGSELSWYPVLMNDIDFEWDDAKAARNAAKHGVSFEIAREAFNDPNSIEEADPDPDEDRWQLTGRTRAGLLLVI